MDRVLSEMRRYCGHGDPPPIRGGVFNAWVRDLVTYHTETQNTIKALEARIEELTRTNVAVKKR